MVGHRGADQSDAARLVGYELEHMLGRHRSHAAVRRSAHHAVRAAARASSFGFDQKHRAKLGVRRDDLRTRRQPAVVGLGDHTASRRPARNVKSRERSERVEQNVPARTSVERVQQFVDRVLCFAKHEHVDERLERRRIRERERPAGNDQRMGLVAVLCERRDTGEVEHLEQAGDLELVTHRKCNNFRVDNGPLPLVGDKRHSRRSPVGRVVGQKRALCGRVGAQVDLAVDRLEPERAHADVVRAGVAERDAEGRLLEDRSLFGGEPLVDRLDVFPACHANLEV